VGRKIRVVVGEGRTAQQGLLRFVLEGEGFDVVGEASTTADLAIAIADGQPDVVVLDDGIGVMAVSMVHEALPDTKIVLVWPSAVVPIGGDARVEPAKILSDLGTAVRHVAPVGVGAGVTETFDRPEWIDRIRKDPSTLRDELGATEKETPKRPSVTQLQRRGSRLHPGRKTKLTQPMESTEPREAPEVPELPVPAVLPVAAEAETAETAAAAANGEERSEWNRRLGTLALSGAAAVSALVLAIALGGGRGTPSIIRGGGFVPPGTGFAPAPPPSEALNGGSRLGVGGFSPIPVPGTTGSGEGQTGGEQPADQVGSGDGSLLAPVGGDQTGSDSPGGGGGGPGGGGGNGGGGGVATPQQGTGNPFGGPPSKLGLTPAHGEGLGHSIGPAADHANGHAHKR
jgi:hypothetical protein